jgi:putative ABC transport system permease protein
MTGAMPDRLLIDVAYKSLWNRRLTAVFTLFAIGLSVALLLGVERLRADARAGFADTISGVDLIVGGRSGGVQLLLYSVFHIGSATHNIGWRSYEEIAAHPNVAWSVPLSLGDSHRGYRVVGTTPEFFRHYRYARDRALGFASGAEFGKTFDAVLGAEVAERLAYRLGDEIVIAHGAGDISFVEHSDMPFTVTGILARTGTPVDRSILVGLDGIEAIHLGWESGAPPPGMRIPPALAQRMDLTPKTITAFLVGLDSRTAIFRVQRHVNDYRGEPLLAILPGATLQELWDLIGVAERALLAISAFVVLVGMAGMLTVLLAGLEARRREMAVLRSVGAKPRQILALILGEAAIMTMAGIALGVALLYALIALLRPVLEAQWGLYIGIGLLSPRESALLAIVFVVGLLSGILPAWLAYHRSLADGLTVRL